MVAAGATGQVYEPDGMILGFISVINGPSLSVLWKERDALTGSGIHRVRFPQTERVNYIRVACVSTLVFVVARCKPLVPRPIRASGTGRGGAVLRQLTLLEVDRMPEFNSIIMNFSPNRILNGEPRKRGSYSSSCLLG